MSIYCSCIGCILLFAYQRSPRYLKIETVTVEVDHFLCPMMPADKACRCKRASSDVNTSIPFGLAQLSLRVLYIIGRDSYRTRPRFPTHFWIAVA